MRIASILAISLVAGTASANVVATFGFTDLSGSYDSGTGLYRAVAADNAQFSTSGDVTAIGSPFATATYAYGFTNRSGFANADFSINVTMNNGTTAVGAGSFTIMDDNGDTLTGDISGLWINGGSGFVYFNGSLSNVSFNDITGDGTFDGPDGGGFSIPLTQTNNEDGAIIGLFFRGANFFGSSFDLRTAQIAGQILPTPGSLALACVGGLALARRRR